MERRHERGELLQAARRSSTVAVMVHSALAERFGLSASDMKTLELLDRLGPLSAGDLARHTGLAATSVTHLIDRLEQRSLVRRTQDQDDRRRVVVELVPERPREMTAPYAALAERTMRQLAPYTNEELALLTRFLTESADGAELLLRDVTTSAPSSKGAARASAKRAPAKRRPGK